ncbi:hypothetical protein SDRG_10529 [Saprolegnia diclina VS20]|uniref:Uncharacterized protein n=1 Tax=Saprolegnia diclina (strain VS20) TaxID=1156394 RepID=T0Q1L7_SAPDV|nr:hypothetical protein SDRG_10529 [Saprolegnia diclina VS20]EQC31739.1 hypothetical protein SDRG_10529 [Saprolegnia diclina VS20]|eukprot:XP_008614746.1 hypothetical protein SDRG_10529 [Saprolegnia diclina VS20]
MRCWVALALWSLEVAASSVKPSALDAQRGTCLDADWVQRTATAHNLDPIGRDSQNRRVNPLLQPALKAPRFFVKDPRMDIPNIFGKCMQPGEVIHGVGETVYANGSQAYAGVVNGTVILERNAWASHDVNRAVLSILLDEVVGYSVSILDTADGINCAERMSFQGLGRCTPTHVNGEVWPNGKLKTIEVFANSTKRTTTGYGGQSGLYTLTDNVREMSKGSASTKGSFSEPYAADYWRDYASVTEVINFYSMAHANLSQLVIPSMCPNGTLGCIDGCSKSYACTQAETQGKQCMLVAMMDPAYDVGFIQALVSNNNIPAYFCFGGDAKMRNYVTSVMHAGGAVVFYEFQPDTLFYEHPGKFTRIAFPTSNASNFAASTNSFGENGYGQPTTNPIKTDYPMTPLLQYISLVLKADTRLTSFVTQLQLAQLDLAHLLESYVDHSQDPTVPDPAFAAACHWVQDNYITWSNWIMPLPLCTLEKSVSYIFIFPALCMFWKAVITFIGLYVSFLIRHDDGDFQESMWIFSAACVVLMGSLFLIPLSYLVKLPATTSFAFCSVITLVCTLVVMGLMLGPKFARLNLADLNRETPPMRSSLLVALLGLKMSSAETPTPSLLESQRGSCLDAAWVQRTAATYKLDPHVRDAQNRRVNPFLQPGMKVPRFTVQDPRMNRPNLFGSCMASNEIMHGLGETVYANGSQAFPGVFNGTLILERNGWQSHDLSRVVLSILLTEVLGYGVTTFETGGGLNCAQRMSFQGLSHCTPTHINSEVWTSGKLKTLNVYANATMPTTTGYNGMGGLYTLTDNVVEALKGSASTKGTFSKPFALDFWRDYYWSDQVIQYFGYNQIKMAPLVQQSSCPDNSFGCRNGCSKSYACTLNEQNGKSCMMVAMMDEGYDPGFVQAMMSNNNIPAYFCFLGYDGMLAYVVNTMKAGGAVAFYDFEPDILFYEHPGAFTHVTFPQSDPANIAAATGSFGENGYGQPTTNPLATDYPLTPLVRYISKIITGDAFLMDFLMNMQIAPLDMDQLFSDYVAFKKDASVPDPVFTSACKWVQNNYVTWSDWVDPLPLCTLQSSVSYTYQGCNASTRLLVVMGLMLGPKFTRLNRADYTSSGTAATKGVSTSSAGPVKPIQVAAAPPQVQ